MKKSSMYVVLLLIVLVLSVGVSIYALTNDTGREEKPGTDISDNSVPSPGQSSNPNIQVQTPSPSPESSPEASAAPTQTPVSTPTPTPKPTPTPTPTPEPTPTPPQNVSGSGSFASNSGTGLNLLVEWTAYSSGGSPMLRVDVSARHYSFFTSALWNAIEVKVNGATYTANSKEVSYDGTELTTSPMASFDIPALRGDNSIEVVWHYRGSYSGVKLDTIECSSTAYVG